MEWNRETYIINVTWYGNVWQCNAPQDKAAELLSAITETVEKQDRYDEELLIKTCNEIKAKILGS